MKRFNAIQAVTFDVGNTLIEPFPSVGQVYFEVASAHGCKTATASDLEQRFRQAFHAHCRAVNTRSEWRVIVNHTFAGLMPSAPGETFFSELYERFTEARVWRIFDDVLPALEALRLRGLKLGVISNWDDRLRPLLTRLGLSHYFHLIVPSCEVGASKPDRAIFAAAVNELGIAPPAVLHIGDSLEMDVAGARAAGLNGLRINRDSAPAADDLNSLLDLPNLV